LGVSSTSGVALAKEHQQIADRARLIRRGRGFQNGGEAVAVAHGGQEDPPADQVERRCFQVELGAGADHPTLT
jgi:hypothetical protein